MEVYGMLWNVGCYGMLWNVMECCAQLFLREKVFSSMQRFLCEKVFHSAGLRNSTCARCARERNITVSVHPGMASAGSADLPRMPAPCCDDGFKGKGERGTSKGNAHDWLTPPSKSTGRGKGGRSIGKFNHQS